MVKKSIANRLLKKWTTKLRLQDWKIDIQFLTEKKFKQFLIDCGEDEDSVAVSKDAEAATDAGSIYDKTTRSNVYHRTATIAIQKTKEEQTEEYIEAIIVHELVHMLLSHISPYETELEVATVEKIVDTLENALLTKEK